MLNKYHPEVIKAGVKIDLLSVTTDSEDKPALTLYGYPCYAVIRVVGIKDRTKGQGDVEIVIDEAHWMFMSDAEKDALIDHELFHIDLKLDGDGKVKTDGQGRPKIGMRKHTTQVGWFAEVAERHGAASFEVQQAQSIFTHHRQSYFSFVAEAKTLSA